MSEPYFRITYRAGEQIPETRIVIKNTIAKMNNNENNHPASRKLYRAEQVRELDRITIQEFGISGYVLMTRAGEYAFQLIREHYPHARSISIFCGSGNNAGDGYIVARLALLAGFDVQVYSVSSVNKLQGDARSAFLDFKKVGGNIAGYYPANEIKAEIVVDALLLLLPI